MPTRNQWVKNQQSNPPNSTTHIRSRSQYLGHKPRPASMTSHAHLLATRLLVLVRMLMQSIIIIRRSFRPNSSSSSSSSNIRLHRHIHIHRRTLRSRATVTIGHDDLIINTLGRRRSRTRGADASRCTTRAGRDARRARAERGECFGAGQTGDILEGWRGDGAVGAVVAVLIRCSDGLSRGRRRTG